MTAKLPRWKGAFDVDGVCRMMMPEDAEPPEGFAIIAEVRHGLTPNTVYFDADAGKALKSRPSTRKVPDIWPVGEPLTLELPAGTVADVAGERQRGTVELLRTEPGNVLLELLGAERGSFIIEFRTYREDRAAAFLPLGDQLDLIYKDPEKWRAHVALVKASFPKTNE